MQISDADAELLKPWVAKRLEDLQVVPEWLRSRSSQTSELTFGRSDADADVLTDFVIALIRNDEPEAAVRANAITQLNDFLPNGADRFVDQVFLAIKSRSYDPSYKVPPATSLFPKPALHQLQGQFGSAANYAQPSWSHKRKYHDLDADSGGGNGFQAHHYGSETMNHTKRTKNHRSRDKKGSHANVQQFQLPGGKGLLSNDQEQSNLAGSDLPALPYLPPFNPNDPVGAVLAFQQALSAWTGIPIPSPSALSQSGAPIPPPDSLPQGSSKRCREYDSKGFCKRGRACTYKHDNSSKPEGNRGSPHARTKVKRSGSSLPGQKQDQSNTTLVVGRIPDDKLDEQVIQEYFSEFGPVVEVQVQALRHSAVVIFGSWAAANAAHKSPKAVFGNRFVQVHWQTRGTEQGRSGGQISGPEFDFFKNGDVPQERESQIDPLEFAKKQFEAQRKHEEMLKNIEVVDMKRKEIDMQIQALEGEKRKYRERLMEKGSEPWGSLASTPSEGDSEQTRQLKATLAKLEDEARSLGIDPDAASVFSSPTSNHGRGRFRGRGHFLHRGRGGYRGGWASPGTRGGTSGGAVKRLDNRPKTVCVAFEDSVPLDRGYELLREHMTVKGLEAEVRPHPEKANALLVQFEQRYKAEIFTSVISHSMANAGKIELSWYAAPSAETTNETRLRIAADQQVSSEDTDPLTEDGNRSSGSEASDTDDDDPYLIL